MKSFNLVLNDLRPEIASNAAENSLNCYFDTFIFHMLLHFLLNKLLQFLPAFFCVRQARLQSLSLSLNHCYSFEALFHQKVPHFFTISRYILFMQVYQV